jgi:hypothetical protein
MATKKTPRQSPSRAGPVKNQVVLKPAGWMSANEGRPAPVRYAAPEGPVC